MKTFNTPDVGASLAQLHSAYDRMKAEGCPRLLRSCAAKCREAVDKAKVKTALD